MKSGITQHIGGSTFAPQVMIIIVSRIKMCKEWKLINCLYTWGKSLRTLKGLLDDYNHMLSNHNFPKCERTSKLKSKNLEMQSVSIIDFRKIKALSFTFQKEAAIQKLQLMLGEFLMTIYYAMLLVGWENKKFYKPYMAATSKVFGLVEISNCKPEECTMNNPQIVALGDLLLAYLFPGKFQVNVASPNFLLLCKICENMGFP